MIRSSHWGLFASSSVVLLILFLSFCACVNFWDLLGGLESGASWLAADNGRPRLSEEAKAAQRRRLTWEGTSMVGVIIGGAELRNRVDVEQACVRRFVWRKGAARDP